MHACPERGSGTALATSALLLLITACFALDEEPYEPPEPPLQRTGLGLEAEALPLGPDFESAEVILFVNGQECARRTMSPWKSRWSPTELCGDPANRAELQFVAPAGRCAPGGVYAYTATAVDPAGAPSTFRGLTLAAWDASGAPLPGVDLGIERTPTLLAYGAETATPSADVSLGELGRWSYRLELGLVEGAVECPDTLLLSLLVGETPEELTYRVVRAPVDEDGTYLLRVRPEKTDLPMPALEIPTEGGAWEEVEAAPSARGGWTEFPVPADAQRFRFSFPFPRLAPSVAARVAHEPREEVGEPLWVEAEAIVPRVLVQERLQASEAPDQPLPLAEHLARLFAGVAALQAEAREAPIRLHLDAAFEEAGIFRLRLPLVRGEAEYRSGRDESGSCEDAASLPCAFGEAVLGALAAQEIDDKEGTLLLGIRWYGAAGDASPRVELREVALPAAWIAELDE